MTPGAIARRTAVAHQRIFDASLTIAESTSLDTSGLAIVNRNPQVQAMMRLEALAGFMESLAAQPSAIPDKPIAKKGKKNETDA